MPRIFSYGTLQREDIQLETFGRRLVGEPDALLGFELERVAIDEPAVAARLGRSHYDNAVPAGPASRLPGTVLEVTDDELLTTDRYERGAAYRRVAAQTASGLDVWVYVHAP
jgi:Gamma-glutamyl cyclotransferase, AIG2-like